MDSNTWPRPYCQFHSASTYLNHHEAVEFMFNIVMYIILNISQTMTLK